MNRPDIADQIGAAIQRSKESDPTLTLATKLLAEISTPALGDRLMNRHIQKAQVLNERRDDTHQYTQLYLVRAQNGSVRLEEQTSVMGSKDSRLDLEKKLQGWELTYDPESFIPTWRAIRPYTDAETLVTAYGSHIEQIGQAILNLLEK